VLASTVRLLNKHINDSLPLRELHRVDKVSRAHLPRPRLLAVVNIDRDNLLRVAGFATLDDGETDGTESEDGGVVAGLHVGRLGAVGGKGEGVKEEEGGRGGNRGTNAAP
jgi:hypothetical protein